jgi:hypothetical protein
MNLSSWIHDIHKADATKIKIVDSVVQNKEHYQFQSHLHSFTIGFGFDTPSPIRLDILLLVSQPQKCRFILKNIVDDANATHPLACCLYSLATISMP